MSLEEEMDFSGNPKTPHFSRKTEVATWPTRKRAIQLVAPNLGANTSAEVTTIAPKIPPVQIHQGWERKSSENDCKDFHSPTRRAMNPKATVPTKKEIVEANQELCRARPRMELMPGWTDMASPERIAKKIGIIRFMEAIWLSNDFLTSVSLIRTPLLI